MDKKLVLTSRPQPKPDLDFGEPATRTIREGKRMIQITLTVRDRKFCQGSWYYKFEKDGQLYLDEDKEWFRFEEL